MTTRRTNKDTRRRDNRTQTDTKVPQRTSPRRVMWRHLFLILETDRPLAGGSRYTLQDAHEVRIGRGAETGASAETKGERRIVDVRVSNIRASEEHCRLTWDPSGWIVEDLGSKNGTFINGTRISSRTVIRPGDVMQVGRAFFTVGETPLPGDAPVAQIDSAAEGDDSLPGFPTLLPELSTRLRQLAPAIDSTDPMTIVGETGTGKEVLARAIHEASRQGAPFVPVNCGALTPSLVEGQLFGYLRGAYSGAERSDPGFVRLAERGTLLLDEVLDLPMPIQAKLLRVLQESEVVALGTARGTRVNVRFLTASQRLLADATAAGTFRPDLAARLDRHVIELPPLRQRREDFGLLAAAILRRYGATENDGLSFPARAVPQLLRYRWPGNIREFENALVRSLRFASDGVLDVETLPGGDEPPPPRAVALSAEDKKLRDTVLAAVRAHRGNVTDIAKELGTRRQQVYRWLRRFDIDPEQHRTSSDP